MAYPFVQAWFDDGVRKGPALGLMFHMAEGGGTVGYLDTEGDPPPRGVSVHAVGEYSGRVVQMLEWSHASGSLNPADRSVDTGYYGHSALVDVLGDWWRDPNSAVLSMEIEGHAAAGPNPAQVAGAIRWGLDMKGRFATLRGALGHTDQTDTKPCPGLTPAMKDIFAGVGGHGLWTPTEGSDMRYVLAIDNKLLPVKEGQPWLYLDGSKGGTFSADAAIPIVGAPDGHGGQFVARIGTGTPYPDKVVRATDVLVVSTATPINAPPLPPPVVDCSDVVTRELAAAATRAADAVRSRP